MIHDLAFMPLIIVLILLGSVVFIILRAINQFNRTTTSKKRPLFFSIYVCILLISSAIYMLFYSHMGETIEERDGDFVVGGSWFYEVMNDEMPIEQIAEFKQTDNTYPLTGTTFDISDTGGDHFFEAIDIMIVKDPSIQHEFRVQTYQTPSLYDKKDITPFLHHIQVTENDEGLKIHLPNKEVVLNMYDYSFPVKQFSEGRDMEFSGHHSIQHSSYLIIVYIPTDVEPDVRQLLDSGTYHIEMQTDDE